MQASEIMTREVITVGPEMPVKELARLLVERGISGAPVLDPQGELVGIVTEKDLIERNKRLHLPTVISLFDAVIYLESERHFKEELKKMAAATVGDIMTRKVVTVTEETPLTEIATIMSEQDKDLLPVLRGRSVVGIVGKSDMVRAMLD